MFFSYLHCTEISTWLLALSLLLLVIVNTYTVLSVLFIFGNVIDVYVSVTFTCKRPLYAGAIHGTLSLANLSTMVGVPAFPNISWRTEPSPKLYLHSRVILLPSTAKKGSGGSFVNAGALPNEKRQWILSKFTPNSTFVKDLWSARFHVGRWHPW